MSTEDKRPPPVRMRPQTYALFTNMHEDLNRRLNLNLSKAQMLELVVNSASIAYQDGRFLLQPKPPITRDG